MSISMRQVEKVLRKAGVKYSKSTYHITIYQHDGNVARWWIDNVWDELKIQTDFDISFKFNSLTSDGDSLYFSFKGQEPLIVKIK